MKTFAYRNPLRGLEHLPFDEALRQGQHLLGGNGYLSNEDYRQLHRDGRITEAALTTALQRIARASEPQTVTIGSRHIAAADVWRGHLLWGFDPLDPALLAWELLAEGFEHRLWNSTLSALNLSDPSEDSHDTDHTAVPNVDLPAGRTISDWLGILADVSLVEQINDQMISWSAAFLDEGMAGWEMPGRQQGFYRAWRELAPGDFSGRFLGIRRFATKVGDLPDSPEDAIAVSLTRLDIPEERWTDYLSRLLAQLPGWAGFIRWRSENPDYHAQKDHPIDPVQYLAVRLFYEVELVDTLCRREWGIDGTRSDLVSHWQQHLDQYQALVGRDADPPDRNLAAACHDAWRLFQLARHLELTPDDLQRLPDSDIRTLLEWLDALPADEHGAVWLEALESSYRDQLIRRLSAHRGVTSAPEARPRAQLVLCIDARSESFRRHIESQGPYETYGFAGFFGVAISYQAFDRAERAALCPVIVAPGFAVDEVPRPGEEESLDSYATGSRWNQLGQHLFHDLKRNPVGSLMLIDVLGLFFSVGLVGKTFFQNSYASITSRIRRWLTRPVATRIPIDLDQDELLEPHSGLPHGFSPEEQATFVEKGLRAIGLTSNFGRFIVLCGHGSTSDNNPYFAAYNCGACGGGHGDANARVFAAMANQPRVRDTLKQNGLDIPEDTWFLAAKHDTATDQVAFYDEQDVPHSHADDLRLFSEDLKEAGSHQALERCQRVPGAPRSASPAAAARHMVTRSVDWGNVRPEWGLSSNSAFILGRRTLTRGLDLGGRVFLHSYDPLADTSGDILEALMNAPLVVAQWISMEYYFSAVDPEVYGSGSKVTHNVVAGVGVMHGSHGDLQPGLPLQSVNDGARHFHEPVRLLAILEAPTTRISNIIQKHTLLQHLFHNQWVTLVSVDPDTGEFLRYLPDSSWEPYRL